MNTPGVKSLFAALAFAISAATPVAASVLYAEGADLSSSPGSPTAVGSLLEGTNLISGSIDAACDRTNGGGRLCRSLPSGDYGDAFSFLIGDDLKLVSATVSINNYYKQGSGEAGAGAFSFGDLLSFVITGNVTDANILPGNDISGIQIFRLFTSFPTSYAALRFDWVMTLKTEARVEDPQSVPLPGTLPLALAAMGSLALVGARRKLS